MPDRVEDERLEAGIARRVGVADARVEAGLAGGGAHLALELGLDRRAGAGEHAGDRAGETAARRGAEEHLAVDQRLALLVAVELDRLRQADVAGDEAADPAVDDSASRDLQASLGSLSLENRDDALAAGGADRDQAAALAALGERLGERRDDPAAGRRERVAGAERAAVHVQLRAVDLAERRRRGRGAACRTPGPPTP